MNDIYTLAEFWFMYIQPGSDRLEFYVIYPVPDFLVHILPGSQVIFSVADLVIWHQLKELRENMFHSWHTE